jgi:hypothetical protein
VDRVDIDVNMIWCATEIVAHLNHVPITHVSHLAAS